MSRSYKEASDEFANQWTQPNDIFSVLLILGGDVIQLACASMAGSTSMPPNPVTFSFGWVAYAISALLSAIGENRLITCQPEAPLMVINLKSGYRRSNNSWLLGRLIKTYQHWMPDEVREKLKPPKKKSRVSGSSDVENSNESAEPELTGAGYLSALCIAVYEWQPDLEPGVPRRDLAWWSGYFVSLIQLAVSVIPLILYGDWAVLLTTAAGTILSYSSASLPQWRYEKWKARRTEKPKAVALTAGNGSPNVIIIEGAKDALDLEDLAAGGTSEISSTRYFTFLLSLLWLVLLITCTGIQSHTWYLLAVGGIGMLHNIVVAAVPRQPEALGIPIKLKDSKTGSTSQSQPAVKEIFAEFKHEGWGKALRDEFFPGKLMAVEIEWWDCDPNKQGEAEKRKTILDELRKQYRQKKQEEKNAKSKETKPKIEEEKGETSKGNGIVTVPTWAR
ncbi:hypothetical protein J3E68DRAFT_448868 [Trichoderma sp. SZMC 28012]